MVIAAILLVGLLAGLWAWAWLFALPPARRYTRSELCGKCGYSLAGLTANNSQNELICPECGSSARDRERRRDTTSLRLATWLTAGIALIIGGVLMAVLTGFDGRVWAVSVPMMILPGLALVTVLVLKAGTRLLPLEAIALIACSAVSVLVGIPGSFGLFLIVAVEPLNSLGVFAVAGLWSVGLGAVGFTIGTAIVALCRKLRSRPLTVW